MKKISMLLLVLVAAWSLQGCALLGINKEQVDALIEHATAEFKKALEEYRNRPVEVEPEAPVVKPPVTVDYIDPPAMDHGRPYTAIAHEGSRWKQYPSGYFDGGFLESTDGWVIPGGMRAILLDNGGRDCGGARLLHVIVRKLSDAKPSFAKGDGGQVVPDKTEWRFIIEGGFELILVHNHDGDSTVGMATVIDHVRNVKAQINPNGKGATVNGKLIRVPHVYKDKSGKEWPTSSRYPYWKHSEPGGNQWPKPLRAPTLVNYP